MIQCLCIYYLLWVKVNARVNAWKFSFSVCVCMCLCVFVCAHLSQQRISLSLQSLAGRGLSQISCGPTLTSCWDQSFSRSQKTLGWQTEEIKTSVDESMWTPEDYTHMGLQDVLGQYEYVPVTAYTLKRKVQGSRDLFYSALVSIHGSANNHIIRQSHFKRSAWKFLTVFSV